MYNTFVQSLHGRQDERILHELKEWKKNFISVQQFMDDLAVSKGRIRSIQEEVIASSQQRLTSSVPVTSRLSKNAIKLKAWCCEVRSGLAVRLKLLTR